MLLLLPLIFNAIAAVPWQPDLRIVGGYPVLISERPFQVVLYRITSRGAVPDCGGSIIGRRWILTAAHCVYGLEAPQVFIRVGIDDLDDDNPMSWYEISEIIPHEGFDTSSERAQNDIALLKTRRNLKYSTEVQPIGLAKRPPRLGDRTIISGFGLITEGSDQMSKILMAVPVTVLAKRRCRNLLAQIPGNLILSETHFCAAYLDGGRDACQGDSGGPVTIDDTLAGIVSWGIGCARPMVPAFYTDVSIFRKWIMYKMRGGSSVKNSEE